MLRAQGVHARLRPRHWTAVAVVLAVPAVALGIAAGYPVPGVDGLGLAPAVALIPIVGIAFGPLAGFATGFLGHELLAVTSDWQPLQTAAWDVFHGLTGALAGLAWRHPALAAWRVRRPLATAAGISAVAVIVGSLALPLLDPPIRGVQLAYLLRRDYPSSVATGVLAALVVVPLALWAWRRPWPRLLLPVALLIAPFLLPNADAGVIAGGGGGPGGPAPGADPGRSPAASFAPRQVTIHVGRPPSPDPSCQGESGMRSTEGRVIWPLVILNRLDAPLRWQWIDYTGTRVDYGTIEPGESADTSTALGHPWVVTDGEGSCLYAFRVPLGPDASATYTVTIAP